MKEQDPLIALLMEKPEYIEIFRESIKNGRGEGKNETYNEWKAYEVGARAVR